ncbi:Halomucin [Frankliniella fusca]|uniref:Halomucin n=1 Tax=Frankliniella fusca TaxID=407009 RepID=A0AAE1LF19_9NEOP|nr:Halomucin [Frankliniella fusca]
MNNRPSTYKKYNIDLNEFKPARTLNDQLLRRAREVEARPPNVEDAVNDDDNNSDRSRSSLSSLSVSDDQDSQSVRSESSAADNAESDHELQREADTDDGGSENDEAGGNNCDDDGGRDGAMENFDEPHGQDEVAPVPPDEDPEDPRRVIYPGCPLTKSEGTLLIMTFALRFGLSDVAIENLLRVIEAHLPFDNVYGSLHKFKKHMPPAPVNPEREYYCLRTDCRRLLRFEEGEVNKVKKTLDIQQNYFSTLKLKPQLLSLLENRELFGSLRWEDSESDVVNGRFYREGLLERGFVRRNHSLTLQLNTDGVQVFETSQIQMWPILVQINELPYKERKENTILCGLWHGSKPNMNTFLTPFVEELRSLHNDGFQLPGGEPILFKVHVILCTVDSAARPTMQGLKQFSGYYGCSFCLHPGEQLHVGDRGGQSHLYRGDKQQARTQLGHAATTRQLLQRRQNGEVVPDIDGVQEAAVLLQLPLFNIIQSFVPDYLHAVLLGTVKTVMCQFWLDSRRVWVGPGPDDKAQHPYYINPAMLEQLDNLLVSIRPPSEVTRVPRRLKSSRCLYRGHEWKQWLLYYSLPCLKGTNFPAKFVNHWFLLVYGISCFLNENISAEDLEKGKLALRKFVLTAEDVYSYEIMKFNTHLLLHIPKSVECFGGLWAWSTFTFESYNGLLGDMYSSSQSTHLQICKTYLRYQGLKPETKATMENVHAPLCLKDTLNSIRSGKTSKLAFEANRNLTLFGFPSQQALTVHHQNLIEICLGHIPLKTVAKFYKRFIYKHVLYHVEDNQLLKQRFNSVVRTEDNDFIIITHMVKVETNEENPRDFCVVLGDELRPTGDTLCSDRDLGISSDKFVTIVERTQRCIAIKPQSLGRKCVLTFYPHNGAKFCCFPLANKYERD